MGGLFDDLNDACVDTFGAPVVIRRDGQPDLTVSGIFDRRHYETAMGDGGALSSLITSVSVAEVETGFVPVGAKIDVNGRTWVVEDPRPDGFGLTVLILGVL